MGFGIATLYEKNKLNFREEGYPQEEHVKEQQVEGSFSAWRTKWEICCVWEEKRGPPDLPPVHLPSDPDFPMFDPFLSPCGEEIHKYISYSPMQRFALM